MQSSSMLIVVLRSATKQLLTKTIKDRRELDQIKRKNSKSFHFAK